MDKDKRKVIRSFVMISQIGIVMMVPVFLCAGLGWWLDRRFHRECWFLLLLLVGIGAAFRNFYIITKSFYAADMKKEHEQLEYIQSLKNYRQEHPGEEPPDLPEERYKRYPDPGRDRKKGS